MTDEQPSSQPPTVKIGQVWVDNDSRSKDRRKVKVTNVDAGFAWLRNTKTGRTTRVAITRMRPTSSGYRLETDVA